MVRIECILRAAVLLSLAGILEGCGVDSVPYPNVNCCVTNTYYVCTSAEAAGQCASYPPDPTLCSKQPGPCPTDGGIP
jgi:hypothetical protein